MTWSPGAGRHTTPQPAPVQADSTGNQPVSGVRTQVLDERKQVALTDGLDLAAGESRTLTVVWKPSGKKTQTITAVSDPSNAIAETDESDNKLLDTITR